MPKTGTQQPTSGKSPKRVATVQCPAAKVAAWIGLADAALLGLEPIALPAPTVRRLKARGAVVELTTPEAGAILRLSGRRARSMTRAPLAGEAPRAVLGHRQTGPGGVILIPAGELAAWIALARKPAVPTTGSPRITEASALASVKACRVRHNLPSV